MRIYGAGIAGLLAANVFQNAKVFEAGDEGQVQHKAVLRFRSPAVGDAVGIDFRKVRVFKGIALDGQLVAPNIRLANWYSQKVLGKLADRSIWNLEPVDRYIAPEDFVIQLAERVNHRITWNHTLTADEVLNCPEKAVSTLPMSLMKKFVSDNQYPISEVCGQEPPQFQYAGITVRRWRIKNADVFQTIYFADPMKSLFRASITGDLLIAEYMSGEKVSHQGTWDDVDHQQDIRTAFGILWSDMMEPIEKVSQRFGKIAPIDDAWRKNFMYELTTHHNIYSLGRFGTWRNLLLDDVIKDIYVIKKLMNTNTYERSKVNSK